MLQVISSAPNPEYCLAVSDLNIPTVTPAWCQSSASYFAQISRLAILLMIFAPRPILSCRELQLRTSSPRNMVISSAAGRSAALAVAEPP